MKKTILSLFAVAALASTSFAQMSTFKDSYTLDYSTANAANCLSNNIPNNGAIATNGGKFTNATNANAYTSLAGITLTTNTTEVDTEGNPFNMFDFPLTVGSGETAQCKAYRDQPATGLTFATQANAKVRLYIKASQDNTPVRFWLGHSNGSFYPVNSTYNTGNSNTSFIKDITIGTTTTYVDIDYTSEDATQWANWSGKNDIDMWGLTYEGTTDGITVTVSKILFGATLVTANNNANVVNDQVTLAPNPASGSFKVDMTAMNNADAAAIKVLNVNGMLVKEFTSNNAIEVVTTEGLNKGIYMVQVTSGNKIATKKVVVE